MQSVFTNLDTSKALTQLPSQPKQSLTQTISNTSAVALGTFTALALDCSGCNTYLHERWGHCFLGFDTTLEYPKGYGPTYVVKHWEVFQKSGLKGLIDWLWKGGVRGYASSGLGRPNALGQWLGNERLSAWISLTGSLPLLFLNSLMMAGAVSTSEESPFVSHFLLSLALSEHLTSCGYPLSAALMSLSQLEESAQSGHDFANFALQISRVSGLNPQTIAWTTAAIWTAWIPLLGGLLYLRARSQRTKIIPQSLACAYWLSTKGKDRFLWTQYKKEYEAALAQYQTTPTSANLLHLQDEKEKLECTILAQIPKKELEWAKQTLLEKLAPPLKKNAVETALGVASVMSTVISTLTKLFQILGETLLPSLLTFSHICTNISPLLAAVSVSRQVYTLCQDFKTKGALSSKLVKVISVAEVITTTVSSVILVVAIFMPSGTLMVISLILGAGGSAILENMKNGHLRHRFTTYQSVQQKTNWEWMHNLLKLYLRENKEKKVSNISKKDEKLYPQLYHWVSQQRAADKLGFLKEFPQKRKLLVETGVLH